MHGNLKHEEDSTISLKSNYKKSYTHIKI